MGGEDGSRTCPSFTQIQNALGTECVQAIQPTQSNIVSEENLLQDLELQTDSNTRSYGLRHNMLLFLKERGDISYSNYLFWHRLG